MAPPSVYLETTFISYLVGRLSRDSSLVASNQDLTREWWDTRRFAFDLFVSGVVIDEARKGDPSLAAKRLEIIEGLQILDVPSEARSLADRLIRHTQIPAKAEIDALHIAVASVHGMDYLLTWNCAHIANGVILPQVYDVCRAAGSSRRSSAHHKSSWDLIMPKDPIVDEIHQVREELLREHGGMDGYMRHLERLQAELGERVVRREPRKPAVRKQKAS